MATIDRKLPSGCEITVRGMRAKEANKFVDPLIIKRGDAVDQILAACTEVVPQPGPYKVGSDGKLDWDQVFVADRFVAMIAVRVATYGPDYEFTMKCGQCGERYHWTVNLNELDEKPIPAESLRAAETGQPIELTMSDGVKLKARLPIGADEKRGRKLPKDKQITAGLAGRIVEVVGVAPGEKYRWVEDLPLGDLQDLVKALDSMNGGIDTKIGTICTECGEQNDIDLPFGRTFFLPSGHSLPPKLST